MARSWRRMVNKANEISQHSKETSGEKNWTVIGFQYLRTSSKPNKPLLRIHLTVYRVTLLFWFNFGRKERKQRKRLKFKFTMNEMGYDFMLDSISCYVFIPLSLCPLNTVFRLFPSVYTSNSRKRRVRMS